MENINEPTLGDLIEESFVRLVQLGVRPDFIKQFSETNQPINMIPPTFMSEELLEKIKEIISEKKLFPYMIVASPKFPSHISVVYTSRYKEDWALERKLIEDKNTMAYVYNTEDEDYSEIGVITLDSLDGGLFFRVN